MSLSKELSSPAESLKLKKTAESRKVCIHVVCSIIIVQFLNHQLIWDVIHGYMEFTPLLIVFMDTRTSASEIEIHQATR